MKVADLKNPVRLSWLREQGCRLDASPFLSDAIVARARVGRLPRRRTNLLHEVTKGHEGGIYHAGREGRHWVDDPSQGVPFLGSTDILAVDLSRLPLMSKRQVSNNPLFQIHEGYTLITRSGTIGRTAYCRPDMDGLACSEHVMRVVPDADKILPGYLYAWLSCRYGNALVIGGTYGSIIQSIEPQHLVDLPVPRFDGRFEERIHQLVQGAAEVRREATATLKCATDELNRAAGLPSLPPATSPTPFGISKISSKLVGARMDAFFHSPYHIDAVEGIKSGKGGWASVSEMAEDVVEPTRFKRVPLHDPEHGVPFFGTSALMRLDPEPMYYLPKRQICGSEYIVADRTLLVPRSGQLSGIIGSCVLPFGPLLGGAVTEDAIRVQCLTAQDAGYLYVALNLEHGRRQLKARAFGTSIPHLDVDQIRQVIVPKLKPAMKLSIGRSGANTATLRSRAVTMEAEARRLVEKAVENET